VQLGPKKSFPNHRPGQETVMANYEGVNNKDFIFLGLLLLLFGGPIFTQMLKQNRLQLFLILCFNLNMF